MKNKKPDKEKAKKSVDESTIKDVIKESADNIIEGAKEVSEISSDVFGKISKFYDSKVKPAAINIYQSSSETFDQVVDRIQDTLEMFKNELEIKSLNNQRDKITAEFGLNVYREFMKNGSITKKFLESKELAGQIEEIHQKEDDILKAGDKLRKKK